MPRMHRHTCSETQRYTSLIYNNSHVRVSLHEQCLDTLSCGAARSCQFRSFPKLASPRDIPPSLVARLGVPTPRKVGISGVFGL